MKLESVKLLICLAAISICLSSCEVTSDKQSESLTPDWAKDLVIYEIATKGFTSPDGPESGTFNSLKDKLPYLEDLGINAIWLTGHSLSDTSHFYGIWTQYACIEPDKLDPSLGTEKEFKEMIAEAHKRGIKIFLDTIEHGVMKYSPIIEEHPEWFKGESWGMIDYDWEGDHPDLEEWWINMWTKAVLDWGIDGFRCDMGLHRPDLWLKIRQRCAEAGKKIFILGESGTEDVSDANQRDIMLFNQRKGVLHQHDALNNLPSMKDLFHKDLDWDGIDILVDVIYEDGTADKDINRGGTLELTHLGLGEDVIGKWEYEPDGLQDWQWLLKGIDENRPVKNIVLNCPQRNWHWQSVGHGWKLHKKKVDDGFVVSGGNGIPGPKFRVISPSCHDCGWDSFPLDKNPYSAQGSRHIMGYAALFAPVIPIFMSGDEFDADYVPLPKHTPGLFGEGEPGTGRWLYASWLQWDQLKEKHRQDMLNDVRRMIEIRREHKDLIHAISSGEKEIVMRPVNIITDEDLPVPYILSNGKRALLVIGNPTDRDVKMDLNLSSKDLGLSSDPEVVTITSLWPEETEPVKISMKDLADYRAIVTADKQAGGGLIVLRFELPD
jgi:hypothetical protein